MLKSLPFLLFFASIFILSQGTSLNPRPQSYPSFKINKTQNVGSCSYRVSIKTSCSSPRYTRDQISISFGDAYGNQVYAPRIDDPYSRAFERCSTDTYEIYGPCTYRICYVYLYRSGYDGWKPDSVTIYAYNTGAVTFYFKTFIPGDVWYGSNYCRAVSSASS